MRLLISVVTALNFTGAAPAWSAGGGLSGGLAEGLQQAIQINMQRQLLDTHQQSLKQNESKQSEQPGSGRAKAESGRQKLLYQMTTTDLLDDPEKLSKISAAAAKHGVTDEAAKFADLAQKSIQRAHTQTMQSLMLGNIDRAIDMARRSGTPFADRPVKVKPNDPSDYQWRVMYEGVSETLINAKDLFDMYSRTATTAEADLAGVVQAYQAKEDREARMDLVDEQKRTLVEQRLSVPTSELRDMLLINEMLRPR